MTDRIEFCQNPLPPLVVGLAALGGAIWMAGVWWGANWALDPFATVRQRWVFVLPAAILAGVGLWELSKLRDTRVKVVVDRDGITDLRLAEIPIPLAEVERIDPASPWMNKARPLVLVLRADSAVAGRNLGMREVVILESGLSGGYAGLRAAIAQLAPQVPRCW